jgi:hypothetical protein
MKRLTLFITSLCVAAVMVACATAPGAAKLTPAQIAAQVCPPTQAALTSLQALTGLPAVAQTDLTKAKPMVDAVCAAGATVNIANLQTLASTGIPAIVTIVQASPLPATDKNNVILGIAATQIILDAVLAADPQAAAIVIGGSTASAAQVAPATTPAPAK